MTNTVSHPPDFAIRVQAAIRELAFLPQSYKITSCSSAAMQGLMNWRQGLHESFWDKVQHGLKVFTIELALPLIALSAIIETAIFGIFRGFTLAICQNEWAQDHGIQDRLESSLFTIYWSGALLFYNIASCDLPVLECEARKHLMSK